MYVCTYVCMSVRVYVRAYVCMYVRMYVCTYVRMYVCMYVYICMYVGRHRDGLGGVLARLGPLAANLLKPMAPPWPL